ncbi:hypothetical protein [Mycobacterium simiae]|uniref:hypothetical protein n=1 Tax=Mycobacterium simiae TaxID=1784 RepID=UPI00165FBD9C|nr:hypothetical protein [Mycobacterium simiae]
MSTAGTVLPAGTTNTAITALAAATSEAAGTAGAMATAGVVPSLHVDYKTAKIKQYHQQRMALRTETTINNPHDFGVTKRLTSLPELRQLGYSANRRLLGVQTISLDPIRGAKAFTDLTTPLVTDSGTRACVPTASSNASPAASATASPTPGSNTRCCSPTPTTIYSAPPWPKPATPAHPSHPRFAEQHTPTRPPSTTSPAKAARRLNPKQPNPKPDSRITVGPLKLPTGP